MWTSSMMQKPSKVECRVYVDGPCFDFVLEAWRLDHNNNQAQAVTFKMTDLSVMDLVKLKDEICTAIQEAMLNKGKEVKGNEG